MSIEKLKNELEILVDVKNGKEINWKEKKELSLLLADSYLRLSERKENEVVKDYFINKHLQIKNCSNFLVFKETAAGGKKLINARFCRARLCPMCTWRKTKKVFSQVSKIIQEINKDEEKGYIFLTLTCKNIQASELKGQIKNLLQAFKKMFDGNAKVKKVCKGYFRALEVTRNNKNNTYHPHIHCVICVNKSYFSSKDYLSKKEWAKIWQRYLGVDYEPVVDVRKANNSYKNVAELSKYTVKETDIFLDSEEKTDDNVWIIHNALHRVRLIGMGGLFKKYHKKLNLDDVDDDNVDLINTDSEEETELTTELILTYRWNVGYKNYILEKREEKK